VPIEEARALKAHHTRIEDAHPAFRVPQDTPPYTSTRVLKTHILRFVSIEEAPRDTPLYWILRLRARRLTDRK